MKHFIELHYNFAEGMVIGQCNLHLCRQSSSTFKQEHVFLPIKVAVSPLQPLARGVLQCLVIGVFPKTKQVVQGPTRTGPGSNPGLRVERPATNGLSHGPAAIYVLAI